MGRKKKRRQRRKGDPAPTPTNDTYVQRLAVRLDGRVLLSTKDLGDRDISGAEIETYIVLPEECEEYVRRKMDDAEAEAASDVRLFFPDRDLERGASSRANGAAS